MSLTKKDIKKYLSEYKKALLYSPYDEFLIEQVTPFDIKTYQNSYLGYLNSYRGEVEVIPGLFTSGDVFNYKAQPTFFNNSNKLHNKDSFNFSLRVESISETGANLTIKVL